MGRDETRSRSNAECQVLASEVVTTNLVIEEIGRLYGFDDLDILNDLLADQGLSRCIMCGTWVLEVDEDWRCVDCLPDEDME